MSNNVKTLVIDNKVLPIDGERNILELARKHGIYIPSFCYHSDLSVYGACRLCLVEIEGMGIQTSCSTAPRPGLVIKTNTEEIRDIRKIAVELMLANHDQKCPSCEKSDSCTLLAISRRLGVKEVRYKEGFKMQPLDESSPALVRDPNKCILCGDCVRACSEIQGIGVLDFANRGSNSAVIPAFGKDINCVECVNCGLCSVVCPTAAITLKNELDLVWKALDNKDKVSVASIAPSVRVGIGDMFGLPAGEITTGKIVAALKAIGFDYVFDTSYGADLTVVEEGSEFIDRKVNGGVLPQFTSCCPAWVKYLEQFYPDLIPNLSSCKSPQQMFGSAIKEFLPEMIGKTREDIVNISIMPCTAKKYEAKQKKFFVDNNPDIDVVITTIELGKLIKQAGIDFNTIEPESFDMPFGFKTGAGVIFGVTGGVTEAVLRFAAEKIAGKKVSVVDFKDVRGLEGIREAEVTLGDITLNIAIVHTLENARVICDQIRAGNCKYDIIEVMTCAGGCINGAGQPQSSDKDFKQKRAKGLYAADKALDFHRSQDNTFIKELYKDKIGEYGNHEAHDLLHTHYHAKKRIKDEDFDLIDATGSDKTEIKVCVGTSCMVKGSQELLKKLLNHIESNDLSDKFDVKATFCFECCDQGPTISVGDDIITECNFDKAIKAIDNIK